MSINPKKRVLPILAMALMLVGVLYAGISGGRASLLSKARGLASGPLLGGLGDLEAAEGSSTDELYAEGSIFEKVPEDQLPVNQQEEKKEWKDGWVKYGDSVYEYKEDILTFLFMGIDTDSTYSAKGKKFMGGQADLLVLLVLDPVDQAIRLIPINRNTMVDVDVYDDNGNIEYSQLAQICVQHGIGDGREQSCEYQVRTVSKLFYQLPIHGYIAMNLDGIVPLNDTVGGVEVTVPNNFNSGRYKFTEGETITLKGQQAYDFARKREIEHGAADRRLERQKVYMKSLISSIISTLKSNPTYVATLYNAVAKYVLTDISLDQMLYIASSAAGYSYNDSSMVSIKGTSLEGEVYDEFYADDEALKQLIIDVFYEKVTSY